MPEWLMGTDCKSVGFDLRWFKSSSAQKIVYEYLFFPIFTNDVIIFSFNKLLLLFFIHFYRQSYIFIDKVFIKGFFFLK